MSLIDDELRWDSAWGRFVAYDRGELVGEAVHVEEGWAASTSITYLGVYLTAEMARGAVSGMRRIEVYGGYYTPPARLSHPSPRRLRAC